MRYKVVPAPRSVAFLRDVQSALPLVPGSVDDCCARILDRTDLGARDDAREYLTFVQALGLATESDRGYSQVHDGPADGELGAQFRENILGAQETLQALEDGPQTPAECFEAIRESVPRWEREHVTDWEAEWRERSERLLGWAVEFGLVRRQSGEYRLLDP
ncbi:hypothetical protein [Haloarcula salinisoli]|uniref:Uncharacterized protein n=1 Tax=Haloarcula salinisoli TaxID=2487746 RepID=A0A8J7YJS6_9EURY|nr:hypothetical protein [Halomicroarcula salinisoli]MBX0287505.1 hypothetical protein [Halomicroarcula salinisoli]MBX0304923.1 hypothetical protein [Halomicroarcula salinisoli]